MPGTIRTCEVKFRKQCPQLWERLQQTEDAAVRFCDECGKNVYYAKTNDEALGYAERGYCIAKESDVDNTRVMVLGMPEYVPTHEERLEWERERIESAKELMLNNLRYTDLRCQECGYPIFPTWRESCHVCQAPVPKENP